MITPGDGWRYIEGLAERCVFEDEVVRHIQSGHTACRRVYSEPFTRDAAALEAVRRQAQSAASIIHPALPLLYCCEMVEGRFVVTMELIRSRSLDRVAIETPTRDPDRWLRFAMPLAIMLHDLARRQVSIETLTLGAIHLCDDMLRISTRCPVGVVTPEERRNSPQLERLLGSPAALIGASFRGPDYSPERSMRRMKTLFYQLATGKVDQTFEEALATAQASDTAKSARGASSMLGVEVAIERILMRMHMSDLQNSIRTPEDLVHALERLDGGPARMAVEVAPPEPSRPEPDVPISSVDARESSGEVPLPPMAMKAAEEKAVAPAESSQILTREQAAEQAAKREKRLKEATAQQISREISRGSSHDEDPNDLYPHRPNTDGGMAAALKAASRTSASQPRVRRTGSGKGLKTALIVVGIVAGLGMVGVGGYFAWLTLSVKPNLPPMAMVAQPQQRVRTFDPLSLDGTGSRDPENQNLRFTWEVKDLAPNQYNFSRNLSEEASRTEVTFFQSGQYTISLTVFDGQVSSAPYSVSVTVTGR